MDIWAVCKGLGVCKGPVIDSSGLVTTDVPYASLGQRNSLTCGSIIIPSNSITQAILNIVI